MADSLVLPVPWERSTAQSWSSIRRAVPHDAAALLLVCPQRPDRAGVLDTRAVKAGHIQDWLDHAAEGDALIQAAARSGVATTNGPARSPTAGLPARMHGLAVAEPSAPDHDRYWVLAFARAGQEFTTLEQRSARMFLSLVRAAFETPPACCPRVSRVLAQPDGSVIHADLRSRLALGEYGEGVGEEAGGSSVAGLLAVEAQRWPGRPSAGPRDLFPPMPDGETVWARLARLAVPGSRAGGAVYVEYRPIGGVAPPPVGLVADDRIARAIGVVTDRYADAPSLKALAQQFDISPYHFQRLFTAQAGISPKHLALRVQLLHARWLLRNTPRSINDIAERCGFASHGHFSATFHRLLGVTPQDFRQGQRPVDPADR